ncbi:sushi, von Willebrand factor type A, EGF and pentraxin domain-containing protein 1-like [Saccoglossus kowalevskii]
MNLLKRRTAVWPVCVTVLTLALAIVIGHAKADLQQIGDIIQNDFVSPNEKKKCDVIFLVDRSQSMSATPGALDSVFAFIKSLTTGFDIDKDHMRVDVIAFSTSVQVEFTSIKDGVDADRLDKCRFFAEVDKISRTTSGYTATTDALYEARNILINSRPDSKKVVFLITDGTSDIGDLPVIASRELLSLEWGDLDSTYGNWNSSTQGLQMDIYAMGIGTGANLTELLSIASDNSYAMYINTFNDFKLLASRFSGDIVESNWILSDRVNCRSSCSDDAICMCGLDTGSYQCVCDIGYQGNGGQCSECPVGTYKAYRSPSPCELCPDGKTTLSEGATSLDDCTCQPGFTKHDDECQTSAIFKIGGEIYPNLFTCIILCSPYGSILDHVDSSPYDSVLNHVDSSPYGSILDHVNSSPYGSVLNHVNSSPYGSILDHVDSSPYGSVLNHVDSSPYDSVLNHVDSSPYDSILVHVDSSPYGSILDHVNSSPYGSVLNHVNSSPYGSILDHVNSSSYGSVLNHVDSSPYDSVLNHVDSSPYDSILDHVDSFPYGSKLNHVDSSPYGSILDNVYSSPYDSILDHFSIMVPYWTMLIVLHMIPYWTMLIVLHMVLYWTILIVPPHGSILDHVDSSSYGSILDHVDSFPYGSILDHVDSSPYVSILDHIDSSPYESVCDPLPDVIHAHSYHVNGLIISQVDDTGINCANTVLDSCHFKCDIGYHLVSGLTAMLCLLHDNGTVYWHGELLNCQANTCDPITDVEYATVVHSGTNLVGDTVNVTCDPGYRSYGDDVRECTNSRIWTGTRKICTVVQCPALQSVTDAMVTPSNCTSSKHNYDTRCEFRCNNGFDMENKQYRIKYCENDDKWTDHDDYISCKGEYNVRFYDYNFSGDFQTVREYVADPEITCPVDVLDYVDVGQSTRLIHWSIFKPNISDNSGYVTYKELTNYENPFYFPLGINTLTYEAEDLTGNTARCSFTITIEARPPVITYCPDNFEQKTSNSHGAIVYWQDPEFYSSAGNTITNITCSHSPGDFFTIATHSVTCHPDGHHEVVCQFSITVSTYECDVPPAPLNGSLTCDVVTGFQIRCFISCEASSDFSMVPSNPYMCNYYGNWSCSDYETEELCLPWPDCSSKYYSRTARLASSVYYYYGACESSKAEIKEKFISQYQHENPGNCDNQFYNCTIGNVTVECGDYTTSRRKRTAEPVRMIQIKETRNKMLSNIGVSRQKRSAANVKISFIVIAEITETETITKNIENGLYNSLDAVYLRLEELYDQSNGFELNIEGTAINVVFNDLEWEGLILTCVAGQVKRVLIGESKCINCPRGTYWMEQADGNICVPCPVGWYQDKEAQLNCMSCPSDTTTKHTRASDLSDCKTYCKAGYWSESTLEPCFACAKGSYQNNRGQSSCERCPTGSSTLTNGSTDVSQCLNYCELGHYSISGLSPCQPCPIHHFQPLTGQQDCQDCPVNKETVNTGAESENDCIVVDECISSPCLHGTCEDQIGSFQCLCTAGFQGDRCEININDCEPDPCRNGATCDDIVNGYKCDCPQGTHCETDIDDCIGEPCENGGSCMDKLNGYDCICPDDYDGVKCKIHIGYCSPSCGVNGACVGTECWCSDGYTGPGCEHNIDECLSNPCYNGGTCLDEINKFSCDCAPGYIVCSVVLPSVQCGHTKCAVWSCQVCSVVIPSEQCGHAKCAVWSCQVCSVVIPSVHGGHSKCAGWSYQVCRVVIPSVQCGHAKCARWFIPSVQCGHTKCSVWSYQVFSVVIPSVQCGHTKCAGWFIPSVQCGHTKCAGWFIPSVQCGHAKCAEWSYQVYRVVIPIMQGGHAKCSVWSCQVSSVVMPSVLCGHAKCAGWSCQVFSVVMPSEQCGHAKCAVWSCQVCSVVIPSVQCGHTKCAGWSYQVCSVVMPSVQCGHTSVQGGHTKCAVWSYQVCRVVHTKYAGWSYQVCRVVMPSVQCGHAK